LREKGGGGKRRGQIVNKAWEKDVQSGCGDLGKLILLRFSEEKKRKNKGAKLVFGRRKKAESGRKEPKNQER